ncbi:hypothetical protein QWZ13_03950 [Reinekea marina]|uniref:SH3 domain-containing protein n=1 Tax=Reinekea marina TaxID=1310421 RepID=A0ABV7WUW5_9GAMM|nr:hypothetical protein [Reinekea marina]MDN3648055.1 hypothetical protein [Reinekea marina]
MKHDSPKKVTLEQLYQQRKANHTLPAELHAQLQQKIKHQKAKKFIRWQFAVPIAFASVMTVVLIVPNREQLNEDMAFVTATQSLPNASAPSVANQAGEMNTERAIAGDQIESDSVYQSAPVEAKAKAIKSTGNAQPLETLMMPDSVYEITADVDVQPESPVILWVTEGTLGLFENCDQEPVQLDAKTDLEGWVKATWIEDEWTFELIGESVEFGAASCE